MNIGLAFWIIMLVWFVFGAYSAYTKGADGLPGVALSFILFLLLGWRVFGAPLHG